MALLDTLAAKARDRRQDRRLHRGAALLPRLRPGVVPEPDRAVGAAVGADRSALARPLARQRLGAELRRIRQGLWLHQGPADVSGQLLPGLVEAGALAAAHWLRPWSDGRSGRRPRVDRNLSQRCALTFPVPGVQTAAAPKLESGRPAPGWVAFAEADGEKCPVLPVSLRN
jgi:hypothetical protein